FLGATLARADEVPTVAAVQGAGSFRSTLPAGSVVVKNVTAGTPAYEFGLNVGDQIVALDGFRVTLDNFDRRIDERRPGDSVNFTVFRGDELRTFNVKLGGTSNAPYRILPVAQPTDEQRRVYQAWLGAPLQATN
ncbi:MAG TPA: PDZ domain-containing protein, partial [Pyrinomonadaceae bacterium]|nr:PDZ domain-containing protein [Pyrinomonadaceae bacterium]